MPSFSIWAGDDDMESIKAEAKRLDRSVSWYLLDCHHRCRSNPSIPQPDVKSKSSQKKPPRVAVKEPKKVKVPPVDDSNQVRSYSKGIQTGREKK